MRLRLGRFASELYYVKNTRVSTAERRARIASVFGHVGYITGLFEYVNTDMLYLRICALAGCMMIVSFQALQPRIQWLSVGWNCTYSAINIFHICLLKWPLPELSEESAALWTALGGDSKLPQKLFQALLDAGEWRSLDPKEHLTEQGSDTGLSGRKVCFIAHGGCDVFLNGVLVSRLSSGGIVGELGALSLKHANPHLASLQLRHSNVPRPSATVVAGPEGMRCLCVPLSRLEASPELLDALQGIFKDSLAPKVLELESKSLQYAALLELKCHAGVRNDGRVAAAVASFRERYGLTDEDHARAEASLPDRCRDTVQRAVAAPVVE